VLIESSFVAELVLSLVVINLMLNIVFHSVLSSFNLHFWQLVIFIGVYLRWVRWLSFCRVFFKKCFVSYIILLADRTNGCAYCYNVASLSSSVTYRYVLWLNRPSLDSLYEVIHEKSIGTKMNELDLCLEVVSRSRQPMLHIHHWISQKRLGSKGPPIGNGIWGIK